MVPLAALCLDWILLHLDVASDKYTCQMNKCRSKYNWHDFERKNAVVDVSEKNGIPQREKKKNILASENI